MRFADILAQREEIKRIAEKHGARNVRVFGSVVRDDAPSESDVDILIDMDRGRSLLDRASIQIELEHILGCKVDVVSERGLRNRIRDRILKEAQPL